MMLSLQLCHRLRASLWIVPLLCVLASIALSFVTVAVDRRFGDRLIPSSITGTPDAASNILSTIATAMVTLTTLVLTRDDGGRSAGDGPVLSAHRAGVAAGPGQSSRLRPVRIDLHLRDPGAA